MFYSPIWVAVWKLLFVGLNFYELNFFFMMQVEVINAFDDNYQWLVGI